MTFLSPQALACIFGGVAHKSAPPPPPPKIILPITSLKSYKKRNFKAFADRETAAYLAFVSIFVTEQMPKEHCLTIFS